MASTRDRVTKESATSEIVVECEPRLCFHSETCVHKAFCDGTHRKNGFCG